jgi:mannose-6-phosphate isomerase-like protein (cupin superfamily)
MTIATFEPSRTQLLHLATDLSMRVVPADAAYWDHTDRRPELADGHILSVFGYEATREIRERHAVGDEFLYVLSGAITAHLDAEAVDLDPGDGVIIPQGAWHRVVVREPGRLLFVTPTPARTEHGTIHIRENIS